MNYYFMPRFPGLKGAVTLANFPGVDGAPPAPENMSVYVAWTDGSFWQVRPMGPLAPGQTRRVTEDQLPDDFPEEGSAFLFLHPDGLDPQLEALPVGAFMNTSPAWRANIQLFSATTAASYQGDYPAAMTTIPKGTLMSCSSFLQSGSGVKTAFLLANLRQKPDVEPATVRFINAKTHQIYKDAPVRSNQVSVIDLSDMEAAEGEMVVALSRDLTGIPLYLSYTPDFSELSLEHTHPPVELVVSGDRNHYQRGMKSFWFDKAYS